jgi:hypothetical protein
MTKYLRFLWKERIRTTTPINKSAYPCLWNQETKPTAIQKAPIEVKTGQGLGPTK